MGFIDQQTYWGIVDCLFDAAEFFDKKAGLKLK
jgi:hypothetical protein